MVKLKVAPLPSPSLSTQILPPWISTNRLVTESPSPVSYSQMLCMALGGDPIFNDSINELYFSDYISKPLRMM